MKLEGQESEGMSQKKGEGMHWTSQRESVGLQWQFSFHGSQGTLPRNPNTFFLKLLLHELSVEGANASMNSADRHSQTRIQCLFSTERHILSAWLKLEITLFTSADELLSLNMSVTIT